MLFIDTSFKQEETTNPTTETPATNDGENSDNTNTDNNNGDNTSTGGENSTPSDTNQQETQGVNIVGLTTEIAEKAVDLTNNLLKSAQNISSGNNTQNINAKESEQLYQSYIDAFSFSFKAKINIQYFSNNFFIKNCFKFLSN